MRDSLFFLLSGMLVYSIYIIVCSFGINNNEACTQWNRIHIGDTTIHIHHWISHSILFFTGLYYLPYSVWKMILLGGNAGGIIHGIYTYPDWSDIIY